MKLVKIPLINFGIIGSAIFFFIYTISIQLLNLLIFYGGIDPSFYVGQGELTLVICSTLGFFIAFYLYVWRSLTIGIHRFLNRKLQWLQYIVHTLLFGAGSFGVLYFSQEPSFRPTIRAFLVTTMIFISAFPFLSLLHMTVNIFFLRLFYQTFEVSDLMYEHNSVIVNLDKYLKSNASILNRCKRYKLKLGVAAIKVLNIDKLRKKHGKSVTKDITRQINFVLGEISRNYEPWGYLKEKNLFFNFFQVKTENEFDILLHRFIEKLRNEPFSLGTENVTLEFTFVPIVKDYHSLPKAPFPVQEMQYLRTLLNQVEELMDQESRKGLN